MKFFKLLGVISLVLILASCEKKADISAPNIYDEQGITFSYPGNWKISSNASNSDVRYIILESPGDAIFIIQIYSRETALPLNAYAKWFAEQAKKETPLADRIIGTFSDLTEKLNTLETGAIREAFQVKLMGQKIPHRAEYYRLEKNNQVAFLISHSSTEALEKVAPGFMLIIQSFTIE